MMIEQPLTGTIGAAIEGVDLTADIPETLADNLREALARHQVIIIRDQFLTIERQKTLTRIFGRPMHPPYVAPLEDEPGVIRVLKEADEAGGVFGGDWHTDFSFLERRPAGSVLNAVETPPYGGDTVWVSQAAAGTPCRTG
jgi:taurine dioxygenase